MNQSLSLQFGNYSNYVGTHFWNIQSETLSLNENETDIDPTGLFRTGQNEKGQETYTPRLVLFETKGNLGSLRKEGYLYYQDELNKNKARIDAEKQWKGKIHIYEEEIIDKNEYLLSLEQEDNTEKKKMKDNLSLNKSPQHPYNLDSNVHYWSDYLSCDYHQKTIFELSSNSINENNVFSTDNNNKINEDAWEKIRYFIEECDSLKDTICYMDIDSSWSTLAINMLLELKEEVRSTNIQVFGFENSKNDINKQIKRTDGISNKEKWNKSYNKLFSVMNLEEIASSFYPLSVPYNRSNTNTNGFLYYNINNRYHTSAVLATAIEMFTSGLRIKNNITNFTTFNDTYTIKELRSCFFSSNEISMIDLNNKYFNNYQLLDDYSFLPGIKKNLNQDLKKNIIHPLTFRGFNNKLDIIDYFNSNKRNNEYMKIHISNTGCSFSKTFPSIYTINNNIEYNKEYYYSQRNEKNRKMNGISQIITDSKIEEYLKNEIFNKIIDSKINRNVIYDKYNNNDEINEWKNKMIHLQQKYQL